MELQKLSGFRQLVNENLRYYREEFGTSKISVKWVYAPSFGGTYPAPDFFSIKDDPEPFVVDEETESLQTILDFSNPEGDVDTFFYPVSLWDKRFIPQKSYYGWLIIEVTS